MTMVLLVACAWTFAVASWFVRRLTRDHRRIMDVARRAAGGDLSARVAPVSADADFSQLGRDLDETIERLATVVDAQRRFIAHASHELRSPLTALLGEITFTLRRERDAAEYRRALQEAQVAAERLKALTDDLLALARLGSTSAAESGEVLLGAAVADAVEDVSAVAQERGVAIARSGLDVLVYGHANDLRRLLRNLLENAVRHSPRGGEVRVEGRDDGEAVLLLIEDDGEGVPAEERERIFDPFFRGARARASEDGGAGLGLAIAREIARRHRGGIACEPGTRGRGARFVVRLRTAPPAMRR
jgi:two-component system heavy metal sensor histidine kinase CusS